MDIQQHIVRSEFLRPRVQVEVPLHIHIRRRPHPQPRDQRRISRASVRNEIPERFSVVSKIFRRPSTTAPPNVWSKKYFCVSRQLIHSRFPQPLDVARCLPSPTPDNIASVLPCTACMPLPSRPQKQSLRHAILRSHSCRSQCPRHRTAAHSENCPRRAHSDTSWSGSIVCLTSWPKQPSPPNRVERPLDHRRPQIHLRLHVARGFNPCALSTDGLDPMPVLQAAAVHRIPHPQRRPQLPSPKAQRIRDLRVHIEPLRNAAAGESPAEPASTLPTKLSRFHSSPLPPTACSVVLNSSDGT